MRRVRGL